MSVYLCIPSAKPAAQAEEIFSLWRDKGYGLAIFRDRGAESVECDVLMQGEYPGYAVACNRLVAAVCAYDSDANWFVCAGDDIEPEPNKTADQIAGELEAHFNGTFGVMQPTGDDWSDSAGRMIERIAGSPFIGRAFAERINQGRGPYWEQYAHTFVDNEIMEVAKLNECFLQRPDLTHFHHHWTREQRPMPPYLADANSQAHWQRYSQIFFRRKAMGFPGSEPLPMEQQECA